MIITFLCWRRHLFAFSLLFCRLRHFLCRSLWTESVDASIQCGTRQIPMSPCPHVPALLCVDALCLIRIQVMPRLLNVSCEGLVLFIWLLNATAVKSSVNYILFSWRGCSLSVLFSWLYNHHNCRRAWKVEWDWRSCLIHFLGYYLKELTDW